MIWLSSDAQSAIFKGTHDVSLKAIYFTFSLACSLPCYSGNGELKELDFSDCRQNDCGGTGTLICQWLVPAIILKESLWALCARVDCGNWQQGLSGLDKDQHGLNKFKLPSFIATWLQHYDITLQCMYIGTKAIVQFTSLTCRCKHPECTHGEMLIPGLTPVCEDTDLDGLLVWW